MHGVQELRGHAVAGARAPQREEQVVGGGVLHGAHSRRRPHHARPLRRHFGDVALGGDDGDGEHALGAVSELVVGAQPVDSAPQQEARHAHTAALAVRVAVLARGDGAQHLDNPTRV